ncbi:TetR/AcrR family transcriptional regulator [Pseudorhodoferax soli]|uniref:TetR family transcriptional regulator n=1 Tax=Pseudorhodoferax soli TaxID=545864 RepID=A0A368X6I4_9BURK|nr:TetR/AcrR family transcriptional regulator [Pseudorhodoferax soli]RCW63621.1 TetR family transcriptional regulator [Pseudorhodoferax soli]
MATTGSTPKPKASPRAAASKSEGTELLLETAQRLFAERGIDAVSMREIAREAGQRNNSALHYHFGSKEALVRAILQAGMRELDILRNDYISRLLATERQRDVRGLVEALVWPLASKLMTSNGNTYNRFLAAVQLHPDIELSAATADDIDRGFRRVYQYMGPALPELPETLLRQRYLSAISYLFFSLADFERVSARRSRKNRGFDMQRAIENLIDMLTGALTAPVSTQVRQRLTGAQAPTEEDQTA